MNEQVLRLNYSPCPNDTFIFYGLASGLVPLPGFRLDISLADVEVLNVRAARGEADVCKVSFAAAAGLLDDWLLLRAGGAMGRGVGPLLVAREGVEPRDLNGKAVAIPGSRTTANLLFGLYCRELGLELERMEMVFDQIMPAVARGEVAAGVVIHEGRFTYAEHGLSRLADLGRWWEERRGLPIPLGVIAVRRALGPGTARLVQDAIRRSLDLARGEARTSAGTSARKGAGPPWRFCPRLGQGRCPSRCSWATRPCGGPGSGTRPRGPARRRRTGRARAVRPAWPSRGRG